MTVGIAAITEYETDVPKVIVSADKMLTTRQQSAIEHEHPDTKLTSIAEDVPNVEILTVFAGSVSLAEELRNYIEQGLWELLDTIHEPDQPVNVNITNVAKVAGREYQNLVQDKIENIVLSTYGLTISDMSKQHQFKDDFFNDVWAQANDLDKKITQNLVLLLGGVDPSGAYVYEIGGGDVRGHNDIGYATIGSGIQPAQSEFIKTGYGKEDNFETGLATVTAANYQAKTARGVGDEMDIGVVTPDGTDFVDDDTVEELIERQKNIAGEQEQVRENKLDDETISWRPNI